MSNHMQHVCVVRVQVLNWSEPSALNQIICHNVFATIGCGGRRLRHRKSEKEEEGKGFGRCCEWGPA